MLGVFRGGGGIFPRPRLSFDVSVPLPLTAGGSRVGVTYSDVSIQEFGVTGGDYLQEQTSDHDVLRLFVTQLRFIYACPFHEPTHIVIHRLKYFH